VAVINKFFALEGKINSLLDIIKSIEVDVQKLSRNNKNLYLEIVQKELQF
jgi:hypothetical protein